MDPTQPTTSDCGNDDSKGKDITTLYTRLAQSQSHLEFVLACLGENIVPLGLKINILPHAPRPMDDEDRVRLERQWEATLHQTSMQLLKHLKSYHRALTTKLLCEVSSELAADSRSVAIPRVDINSCMKNPFFANTYSQLQVRKHRKLSKLRAQQQRLPKRQRKRRCRRRRKPKQKLDPLRTRPVDTVVNLSNVTLSEDETRVLSRGISFCPTPSNFDTTAVLDDLESYFRRVRLHEFFLDQPSEDNSPEARIFREPSSWMPPKGRDQSLEVYIKQVRAAVTKTLESQAKKSPNPNLPIQERAALSKLRKRQDIIIKPADKGSAVVVVSRDDYVAEVQRQLQNDLYYKKLETDCTADIMAKVSNAIAHLFNKNTIDRHVRKYLLPSKPQLPRFYILPKIHKPGNPGRPIIASNNAPTERISQYEDFYLKPLASGLPSYIRDTTHFLCKLRDLPSLPEDALLVSLDVVSLYSNIPHSGGIEACRKALNTRSIENPPTEDLCNLISLILTNNAFCFGEEFFLQTHGTAMGTRMAPSYANIFMGILEEAFLAEQPLSPLAWWRYIDDIFLLWTHGREQLDKFLENLSKWHPTIKFTASVSTTETNFLDVKCCIKGNRIETDLYCKP